MHGELVKINLNEVLDAEPVKPGAALQRVMWLCVAVGVLTFTFGLFSANMPHFWAAYFTSAVFFMGLSVGSVVIAVIFQIVRAVWGTPLRRLAESGVAYFPWAIMSIALTYFGREHLFVWARQDMPGKVAWMQPNFVYARHLVLLSFLFFMLSVFVKWSIRADIGMLRERWAQRGRWVGSFYQNLAKDWKGTSEEVYSLQPKMSRLGPVLIFLYATIYSLFTFEFVMGMDPIWISNLFGGFYFVGNVYLAWAFLAILTYYFVSTNQDYAKVLPPGTRWDHGKLTFGFCMLWGYFFFSQFLPQWYGNLPEETQWMILRTREYPWKAWGWVTFAMCFIMPFILLLSRDLKRTPAAFATVGLLIFLGIWAEKYIAIMPNISPGSIPFGALEFGLFLGFLGMYVLSVLNFLSKLPFIPVSHPQTQGKIDW
jgi:hypothetical protein